jgi:hypothetical protein
MIVHTVLFRWKPEATAEQRQRVSTELGRLPSLAPTLRSFAFGSDLGVNEGNFDFGLSATFDDIDGYLAYRDNPEHRAMIRDHIVPIAESRVAVQFEPAAPYQSGPVTSPDQSGKNLERGLRQVHQVIGGLLDDHPVGG